MTKPTRAVMTVATTKQIFVRLAFALARSFIHWNRDSGMGFVLITDLAFDLPQDLRWMEVIRVEPGALGGGFSPKLHLDRFMPADQSLYIDSDCLCFGPLDYVFERFAGCSVGVIGQARLTGEFFCDIEKTRARFKLGPVPHFNGGVYYLERGSDCSAVYARARELEGQYDEIGLVRLRGRPNEEILIAIAMAERGWLPVPDDGTILGNVGTNHPVVHALDVLSGVCHLSNPPPSDPRHQPAYPVGEARPRIVHFLNDGPSKWPYRAEEMKIRLVVERGLPVPAARAIANSTIGFAGRSHDAFKDTFRPAYRKLFGARRITLSEKIDL